ncbi:MAG TPA: hypothetical protein VMS73_02705 [Anaerolineaceae bacterium]|nr:hypothetical protein [Anaerolineaceae bacterium]
MSIALVINALVLGNSIVHHPKIGYDVTEHLTYVQILPYRLPGPTDTSEYFSAPLPYLLPSLFDKVCAYSQWTDCRGLDGKFMQILNFLLSIGITVLFWRIAEILRPGSDVFKVSLFAMLGILTVYYKTFSQARGEPYVAFFTVLVLFLILKYLKNPVGLGWKNGLKLGVVLGLLILSRQWGFFVFPAIALLVVLVFIKDKPAGRRLGGVFLVSLPVALVVGGWFYLHLYFSYGSMTAFNRSSAGFSFSNQPSSFYTSTGLKNFVLFKTPVRQNFDGTMLPIFYSDTWGDYWGYFSFIRNDVLNYKANGAEMIPYLGRVNLVSLFPTFILLAGLAIGAVALLNTIRRREFEFEPMALAFLFLLVFTSWAGFLWFLIAYPFVPGEINDKASYMIQVFMAIPVLAAFFLERILAWKRVVYNLGLVGLLLVFVHNFPALVTHFNWSWRFP